MDALWIMLKNVLLFVAYALPGFILVKSKALKTGESISLSKLLTYVGMPFLILSSVLSIELTKDFTKTAIVAFVFCLLIIIPSAVIAAIAVILACREALGFSLSLARLAFPETKKPRIEQDFKLYCMRQLFVLIFFVTSAVVQGLMSASFISFFDFNG